MYNFENIWLENFPAHFKPIVYRQFVEDTFYSFEQRIMLKRLKMRLFVRCSSTIPKETRKYIKVGPSLGEFINKSINQENLIQKPGGKRLQLSAWLKTLQFNIFLFQV